ncbi:MAG: hypothetical protein K8R85_05345 [Bacteroidetes bacterium]|nr:hypothetical protein [Bacteroidota bacterium]
MKTEFEVPVNSIIEFSEILAENELENEILGTTDNDELLIEVHFDKSTFDAIEQLEKLVETANEQENEED